MNDSRHARTRHILFAALALLLSASLLVGTPARVDAAVRPTDVIADTPVAEMGQEFAALAPEITVPAGVLVTSDGRLLWARDGDTRRAMASITKIMTVIVAIENSSLEDLVTVTRRAASIGGSALRLEPGAEYPLRTLLEAALVRSGNDASVAVAEHVGGDEEAFVRMMNETAARLGLADTRFANPHGLDEADHYSTAEDVATLARYAMGNDEFRRIASIDQITIEGVADARELVNSNLLIGALEGATGVKTGYTRRAGYCLVGSATREGIELFAVVLGAASEEERFRQAGLLLEWGFVQYEERRLAATGEVVGSVAVADYLDRSFDAVVGSPADVHVFRPAGEVRRVIRLPEQIDAPVTRGQRIGTLSFVQGERLIAQTPLISVVDVRRPTVPERMWIALVRAWRSVFESSPDPVPAS